MYSGGVDHNYLIWGHMLFMEKWIENIEKCTVRSNSRFKPIVIFPFNTCRLPEFFLSQGLADVCSQMRALRYFSNF